ncbi:MULTISPECIES: ExbD/TolR family protein [Sphingopyxis]|jgi:biopolymer transport protein ExbD|uniref:Biopolymer transporter ExbD n=1 Tax=Sphingopyxis granuli TaxID=267128 RepID=A0AA86GYV4_9SPHN|nr:MULTISPECIES: biopolymer transporter ExbD [Sphingopyxis]AMG76323.1 Biopolymer transporter ExbD [Sphingopyxis granuli]AVA15219.1 biopolymer transporter ExbD [Sphingopyxis sp. MG]ODU30025.1 MAG: biopolymer transporter ExbD [Sphingopyxis sp. SCN 67-31]QUM72977.1 biopolymer transporter ExbD [Sphingopyxis granuli]UNK79749.1 biopolymer transporter ExbD [Sphingopyxis granuli]
MAMSVGEISDEAPMSEINVIPLVDIMLVLLIIFLITVPVVLETVNLKLPDVPFEPTTTKPENVNISVRSADTDGDGQPNADSASCEVYWGRTPVDSRQLLERGQKKLEDLIEKIGGVQNITEENFPEVHIRGDVNTPYQCIGGVIYTMQYAGFQKIGFISEPAPGSATLGRL